MSNKDVFVMPGNPLLANKLNGLSKAIEDVREPFIVNLTLDLEHSTDVHMRGTMDKTVSELLAAHNAGKRIWFSLAIEGLGTETFTCTHVARTADKDYPSFNSFFITNNQLTSNKDTLARFITGVTDDPERNMWFANLYPLGE